ncbi:MAG: zinc ribbon-containing protein [Gammaproteobacteria bacterium]|nr:zinc ribbon-containing protein [Gammaproteobacteria bacterium]
MSKPRSQNKAGGPGTSGNDPQRRVSEAAIYRARLRNLQNDNPRGDRQAEEQRNKRLLPHPSQQKHELVAYQKLRADVVNLLSDTKGALSADTIRLAMVSARNRLIEMGEHTADTIDKALASVEKDMLDASHRLGTRIGNLSTRTTDVFYVWRIRGDRFLEQAAHAVAEWSRGIGAHPEQQTYHTGEIAAGGELECTSCGEHLRLETPAHLPLCPKCHNTGFRRVLLKETHADIQITDILFHIPADLPVGERNNIERDLQSCDGVLSAHFSPGHPHMLEVAYNPDAVSSGILRNHLIERGLTVSKAGL